MSDPTVYLPAVIAAAAGLGGAWLGAWAALRAAKSHSQSEQRAWTRDRRERTYAGFLDARDSYVDTWILAEELLIDTGSLRGWLNDHVDEEYGSRDEEFVDLVESRRQEYRRAMERLETAKSKLEDARPAFHRALVDVELFGSEAIRHAARAWAKDIQERYEWLFRPGEYFPDQVREMREAELRQHREPFLELVRSELGIQPDRSTGSREGWPRGDAGIGA